MSSHTWYRNIESWKEIFSGQTYSGEFFHVVGEVANNGDSVSTYRVNLTFYDSEGDVVHVVKGQEYWKIGGSGDNLGPGQKQPFLFILLNESASKSISRYDVSVEPMVGTDPGKACVAEFFDTVFRPEESRVLGWIRNEGDVAMENPSVWVTFYDSMGRIVGAARTYPEHFDRLGVGDVVSFEVLVTYKPALWWASVRSYGLSIQYRHVHGAPYDEFSISDAAIRVSETGYCEITGHVTNTGNMSAGFTRVAAALYGFDDALLRCPYMYTDPRDIGPGQTAAFTIGSPLGLEWSEKVPAYDLFVYSAAFSKAPSEVFCQVDPVSVSSGDRLNITGLVVPGPASSFLRLLFTNPGGQQKEASIRISPGAGEFLHTARPDLTGRWSVEVYWEGDSELEGATSGPVFFDVRGRKDLFSATVGGPDLLVGVVSNASLRSFSVGHDGAITYRVYYSSTWLWDLPRLVAEANVTVPRALLEAPFVVSCDGEPVPFILSANITHSSLSFVHGYKSFGSGIRIEGPKPEPIPAPESLGLLGCSLCLGMLLRRLRA